MTYNLKCFEDDLKTLMRMHLVTDWDNPSEIKEYDWFYNYFIKIWGPKDGRTEGEKIKDEG